jgi:hypothetical protein
MTLVSRWTVGYDFYEGAKEIGGLDIVDRTYHTVFRASANLDASWENHRAARLARAQF